MSKDYFLIFIAFIISIVWFSMSISNITAYGQVLELCDFSSNLNQFVNFKISGNYSSSNDAGQPPVMDGRLFIQGSGLYDIRTSNQNFGISADGSLEILFGPTTRSDIEFTPNLRQFITDTDSFFFIGANIDGSNLTATDNIFENLSSSASIGWGYGRFRDVTPFAKALNIQTQLMRSRKLRQPLLDDTLLEIAKIISGQPANTPISELISGIQETIETLEGNSLVGSLGASSLLHIQRILLDDSTPKSCGWETSIGAAIQAQGGSFQLEPLSELAFRYASAPTSRSQFIMDSRLIFGTDIFSENASFNLDAGMDYSYKLSDMIDVSGRYRFVRINPIDKLPDDTQLVALMMRIRNTISIPMIERQSLLSLVIETSWYINSDLAGWSRRLNVNLEFELI